MKMDGRTEHEACQRGCLVTTIVAKLDPALAKRVAKAADLLGLTHEELAREAIRLFVRAAASEKSNTFKRPS